MYLDNLITTPSAGSSPERREAFLRTAPAMVRFLEGLGLKLRRPLHTWPDYYDDLPGGVPEGRALTPLPFDVKKLGSWYEHLTVYSPIIPIPRGSDEFATLLLLNRTLPGRSEERRVGK